MTFVIEKNIPLPVSKNAGLTRVLRSLEIGNSVFVKGQSTQKVSCLCNQLSRKTQQRFTVRKVDRGCRIWRFE